MREEIKKGLWKKTKGYIIPSLLISGLLFSAGLWGKKDFEIKREREKFTI